MIRILILIIGIVIFWGTGLSADIDDMPPSPPYGLTIWKLIGPPGE